MLLLQNNNLGGIGNAMREELEQLAPVDVDLSGNPMLCDCNNMDFVQWVQKVQHQINFIKGDGYVCKESNVEHLLLSMNTDDLRQRCDTNRPIVIAVSGTLVLVAIVILLFAAYRKRWHLRHFIFRVHQMVKVRQSNEQDIDYEYDAFILYSGEEEDRLWVHRVLLNTLEKDYGMKLHIHLRDFLVGEFIANNIANAIAKSRKTIAIITPNFVRSPWCVEEVHMAHAAGPSQLHLVLYKHIPATEVEVPELIRHLLENKTYCEWVEDGQGERLFWKKIVSVLYK